ncbi:Protein CBG22735 [Caenorhabditis briggsae]|uniref:Protein CBG22735 n=2 Tax=Caenorhabditis briggsae TaxID=6238 RepID=A8Y322_CAEBR|nr:Protein CBG22735 [Caenorhabditis briggsae]ULT84086.1 hypothetical protein L3Y34_013015 [Caenorhabditis briggsae]CAP39259.2 Protein CBG22735 [Caenorhabditis briggsae]
MRLFIIATIIIAFVVVSGEDNSTDSVTSEINSTAAVSSDKIASTFENIDDSFSDDFFSDETITSIITNAHGIGTFQEAHQQEDRLLQCWEPLDPVNATSASILSKPIFTLCSYIPLNSKGIKFETFAVNGVGSEYYDPLLSVFDYSEKNSEEDYEAIVICAIEKLQLHKPPHPPSTAMRCLCNQSGCNVPEPLEEFLKFNRNVFPEKNNATDLTDH